jgi:mono/diheme cytochrome c family protein
MRAILAILVLCTASAAGKAQAQAPADIVARGKALTDAADCASCHTADPAKPFAGGKRIDTPFGGIYSPDLTPDRDTGLGAWSDEEFYRALHDGVARDGSRYYPAFPYPNFTKITGEDVLAIRAYLATLTPFRNLRQPPQLRWPLNYRVVMHGWNFLFFRPGAFAANPQKSDEWNRGAYLAEGLGHCGLCHTPKTILGGDKTGERLQGYALQGWFAADITNDARRGLGGWSVDDVANYLKIGHSRTSMGAGLMAETIGQSTSHMNDADLKAIATYLKDQPGGGNDQADPPAPDQSAMKIGAKIYADECSGCHAADGKGSAGLFPPLGSSALVQQTDPTSLMHIVLRGARSVATDGAPTAPAMPQFAWLLKDDEVAAVLTYIRNNWGNAAPAVSTGEVGKARRAFIERTD